MESHGKLSSTILPSRQYPSDPVRARQGALRDAGGLPILAPPTIIHIIFLDVSPIDLIPHLLRERPLYANWVASNFQFGLPSKKLCGFRGRLSEVNSELHRWEVAMFRVTNFGVGISFSVIYSLGAWMEWARVQPIGGIQGGKRFW